MGPEIRGAENELASAAEAVTAQLVRDPGQRAERLGEIFLACEEVARQQPAAFRTALGAGQVASFLVPEVRQRLNGERGQTFRGGWLGTYIDPNGRAIESEEPDTTDTEALDLSARALQRALSIAETEENQTLLRNLRWYQARLAHKSYDAIARAEGKVAATVRTGVARARKFVLRVVHELQHAQPAPLSGEAPPELEPLRQLWFAQDIATLAQELERAREGNEDNPHWLNLAGLVAADRGQRGEAARFYERALVAADAPSVRGRVLNNLGNLFDDHDCAEEARQYWLRAHQLVPEAPAPLLNLLGSASQAKDYASAQHYIAELANLLNSGRLHDGERIYVSRRLAENPKLTWLRDTDAWSAGPARWIRAQRNPSRARRSAAAGVALGLLLGLLTLLWPGDVWARANQAGPPAAVPAVGGVPVAWVEAKSGRGGRGGDSMGSPKGGFAPLPVFAGDTMGFAGSGGSKKGRGRRRPSS